MNRLKPILAMLMLMLFAFASSHPLLEGLGMIHQETAHTHEQPSSDTDHPLADGEVSVNTSRNELQKSLADESFDLVKILALTCVLLQHEDLSARSSVEITISPPPALSTTWQFSLRAALPARAPSFAS